MDPAGLKTRRSGGNANRSLTTWLNVPVVRRNVRVKFERSHKISLCSTSVGIGESACSLCSSVCSRMRRKSHVARCSQEVLRTTNDGRPTTNFLSPLRSTEIAVADLFIPNKFQVSNESLILAQNQRW